MSQNKENDGFAQILRSEERGGGEGGGTPPMAHGQAAASDEAGAASTRAEDELAAGREEVVVKVGMVGDTQIGKTSLMVKFVEGTFDEDYIQTLGVNFMEKTVGIRNANISFSIWDLGGQREFINMLPLVCNDAAAILFMFDLSRCGPIPGPLLARKRLPPARTPHFSACRSCACPQCSPRRTFMWCTRALSFTRTRTHTDWKRSARSRSGTDRLEESTRARWPS